MSRHRSGPNQTRSYRLVQLALVPALLIIAFVQPAFSQTPTSLKDQVRDRLRSRIEAAVASGQFAAGDELIYATTALPQFYERRGYAPAWSDDSGPRPAVDSLLAAIAAIDREGLHPDDYHLKRIERVLNSTRGHGVTGQAPDPNLVTDLDLLATDAFLICGSHLLAGRVNPVSVDAEWFTKSRERDIAALLDTALLRGDARAALTDLLPNHQGYFRLRDRLREYRQMAANGGWQRIPEGPTMHPGDRDGRVRLVRKRLETTGDLAAGAPLDRDVYDDSLASAMRGFQRRHGLDADGAIGPKTLAALNVSAEERARQIALNLERWRWLPENLGKRHILVNIADFELDVFEGESAVLSMRVIVGRPYRRTPVFSDRMTYVVLNPYWNVPPNLALQDVIPHVRESQSYLADQKIKVFRGWGADMRVIDPATVDWSKMSKQNLPYWFRQEPGPLNSLGRIKFMFPNQFNVYLHDTPKRELFARTERGFSSGCIRIENPLGLAEYLLAGDAKWTPSALQAALEQATDRTITIPDPIPIHILYWTAWVTPSGALQFREDIYKRDVPLTQALSEPPPTAQ